MDKKLEQFIDKNFQNIFVNILSNIGFDDKYIEKIEETLQQNNENKFIKLLDDIERVGSIPSKRNKNEDWVKCYENWTYMLQKSYEEALRKGKLDEAFAFNRKMNKYIRNIHNFALFQKKSYLYYMGLFVGTFNSMSNILIESNRKKIKTRKN